MKNKQTLDIQADAYVPGAWISWGEPESISEGLKRLKCFKKEHPERIFRLVLIETTEIVIKESK